MKKFTFLAITVFFLLGLNNLFAQQRTQPINPTESRLRCATMEALELYFQQNPAARELAEQNKNRFASEPSNRTARQNVVVTIPIVFHIVGNSTRLAQVTDADVMWQLNKLNEDFRGANADSTNASAFYPVRAYKDYCQIQFCLAQRDPNNLPLATPGITRTPSSLTGTTLCSGSNYNMLKHTAQGGIDAWDPTRFFNVWVGEVGDCLLGVSQFPGTGSPTEDGVVVAFEGFGNNPAYVAPAFNLGRTVPHEIGHCFGLYHIWGDESGCTNSDFRQLPGTCLLPASLSGGTTDQSIGDTPNQADETTGCPSGIQTDACSATSPGFNYQNFMDYTNDACYSMFTKKQIDRMQWVLDNCLASLKTSNGCLPPALTPDNASISAIVNPASNFVTCDPTIPLTVTLRNIGSNTLNSVTITVTRNATIVETRNLTGLNLASLATQDVVLNDVSLVLGANSIQICTSLPNGNADSNPANDCMTVTGSRGTGGALPLVEGFEGATFPPAGWIRNNPDGGVTWQRSTTGVAHSGTGKAYVDHYDYPAVGQIDDLRTPPYAIGTADSLWVSYWAAYRGYADALGTLLDNFQVMVSTDCGQTFQIVYNARNDTAFVAPDGVSATQTAEYTPSALDQWKRKAIDLSSFISAGNVQIQFRAINGYGNNLYIDDINIDKKIFQNNDAGVIAINKPDARVCTSSQAPVVVIKNFGKVTLTSVKINYQVDGGAVTTFSWTGSLARNQITTVTLPTAALGAVGNHSINSFTTLPNNVADEDPGNDGLVKAYSVNQVFALPGSVTEEFTNNTFPPTNWSLFNPDGDMTWTRSATVGKKNPGSAFFDDWTNATFDRFDDLLMPNYSYTGIDSIFLKFNVAAVTYTVPGTTGARLDTLTVLLSKDCGNTFTTVYKKWGEDLQTVNDPNFQQYTNQRFIPKANEWRTDSLNLGKWLSSNESMFQITYRFSGNFENNLYLDDINLRTQILPAKLKNQGYLVLPNPFRSSFAVWHYQVPTTLRYINVYNSVGQLVYSRQFPNGGEKYFLIDLAGRAAGTYTVNLGYDDSNRNVNVQVVKY